jgi:hypothetical protein
VGALGSAAAFLSFHASYLAQASWTACWLSSAMHLEQPAHARRLSRTSDGLVVVCHGRITRADVRRGHGWTDWRAGGRTLKQFPAAVLSATD